MENIQNQSFVTSHVTFTREEYKCIQRRAKEEGVKIAPYIHTLALYGTADFTALRDLTEQKQKRDKTLRALRILLDTPCSEGWIYEKRTKLMENEIRTLLELET